MQTDFMLPILQLFPSLIALVAIEIGLSLRYMVIFMCQRLDLGLLHVIVMMVFGRRFQGMEY